MKYYYRVVLLPTLMLFLLLVGCDSNAPEEVADPHLDEDLIALITLDGQRGLNSFMLPASNDFLMIPQDANNPLTTDKVELGKLLFHETALATNPKQEAGRGTYSCATCHHAGAGFQAGRQQGLADGGVGWGVNGEGRRPSTAYAVAELDVQPIRSPSILNGAYQPVMLWSGELGASGPNRGTEARWERGTQREANHLGYDGLETQSITALTRHRMDDFEGSIIATHPTYKALWERVFPGEEVSAVPVGLAIAAFERTVFANQAPFQRWLRGELGAMTDAEKRGALLYFGKAECETCHTGPAFNQMDFYALGMPDMVGVDVFGAVPENRGRGAFLGDPSEDYKFKVPQLYNLKDAPFYGHGGTFTSIKEVVDYYNEAVPEQALPAGQLEPTFQPLDLTPDEVEDLVLFLTESLRDPNLDRYVPTALPSGNCTPANDPAARIDLGC